MQNTPRPRRRWILAASALGSIALALALLAVTAPPAQAQSAEGVPQFNRTCGRCHPDGNEDDGPDLHNKNLSVAAMTKVVREGTKHMRPIRPTKLSDADLARVMVFLRSIHAVR
ncbi:MAG: cytochrome c [Deltaproteobacteria bacterium]|nr:cytochrome c [Deltaproteobacteria bacterium]MBK7065579.1 cytochrome c [Deltaproteobacteria bacterium]MBK8692097.1 cytochrome c [Deltaproteobacteria bacterium]MBP6833450.1 cytochrome c [Deltaproteobacteria bacterium]